VTTTTAPEPYPPTAFYFRVDFGDGALRGQDGSFQEVSGIGAELRLEEVAEGGENRFVHRLPLPPRYTNLVLRRGLVPGGSPLAAWAAATIGSALTKPIKPSFLRVSLLDEDGGPRVCWKFINAFPVKVELAALNAMEGRIAIETLELAYNYFERVDPGRR
jgi:phage tail-like protein